MLAHVNRNWQIPLRGIVISTSSVFSQRTVVSRALSNGAWRRNETKPPKTQSERLRKWMKVMRLKMKHILMEFTYQQQRCHWFHSDSEYLQ